MDRHMGRQLETHFPYQSPYWYGTCGWKLSSYETRNWSSYTVNTMAADDLATQRAWGKTESDSVEVKSNTCIHKKFGGF